MFPLVEASPCDHNMTEQHTVSGTWTNWTISANHRSSKFKVCPVHHEEKIRFFKCIILFILWFSQDDIQSSCLTNNIIWMPWVKLRTGSLLVLFMAKSLTDHHFWYLLWMTLFDLIADVVLWLILCSHLPVLLNKQSSDIRHQLATWQRHCTGFSCLPVNSSLSTCYCLCHSHSTGSWSCFWSPDRLHRDNLCGWCRPVSREGWRDPELNQRSLDTRSWWGDQWRKWWRSSRWRWL